MVIKIRSETNRVMNVKEKNGETYKLNLNKRPKQKITIILLKIYTNIFSYACNVSPRNIINYETKFAFYTALV